MTDKTHWTEVENIFLSNNKRGTPIDTATEAYLFLWRCTRMKRGIKRKRAMETLKFSAGLIDEALAEYFSRADVVLIKEQNQIDYQAYRGEPTRLEYCGFAHD